MEKIHRLLYNDCTSYRILYFIGIVIQFIIPLVECHTKYLLATSYILYAISNLVVFVCYHCIIP